MLTRTPPQIKPPIPARPDLGHPLARRLSGCWLLDEPAGRLVYDVSGHMHIGELSGGPARSTGRFGLEIEFDGQDDWISMGDCLDLGIDDVTLMAIVKYDAEHQPDQWDTYRIGAIAGKGYLDDAGQGYGLFVYSDNRIVWEINNSGVYCDIWSDLALNDSQYHTVAGVCDRDHPAGVKSYIDGLQQVQTADPTVFSGASLNGAKAFAIGSVQKEDGSWFWDFQGCIAAVYMWKRVLTDNEILELHREPFALFGRRRPLALSASPVGGTVLLSGLSGAQAIASASLGSARTVAGSITACTAASASLRAIASLAGVVSGTTTLMGTLASVRVVTLDGMIHGSSDASGGLSSGFRPPGSQARLQVDMCWLCEALFGGMTATAFKLGTALTGGWFWVRRSGCAGIYRGPTADRVDFSKVLVVARVDAEQIPLPTYLSHHPGSTWCYVLRRFNACGQQERTTFAAVAFSVGPDGQPAPSAPNATLTLRVEHVGGNTIRLAWLYHPLGQKAAPASLRIYWDQATGRLDHNNPIAEIPYAGRKFYSYYSDPLADGKYIFAVTAASAARVESAARATRPWEHHPLLPGKVQVISVGTV